MKINYDKHLNNLKKFGKNERSSFNYWFNHWLAFNLVAMKYHCWKFRFLFHDIEKPWMKLFMRDYKKVQKWHREHNKHHITYFMRQLVIRNEIYADFLGMVIDWECSRYTKIGSPLNAKDQLEAEIRNINVQYPTIKFKNRYIADIVREEIEKIFIQINY